MVIYSLEVERKKSGVIHPIRVASNRSVYREISGHTNLMKINNSIQLFTFVA